MNPLAIDITSILEDAGVGTFGTDLFISKEPNSPDNCVTTYSVSGLAQPCVNTPTSEDSEINDFQIRVRNIDYQAAYVVVASVMTALNKVRITESSTSYEIWVTALPLDLQRDTTNRCLVVINFSCLRSVSA
jgi:hypothetical protein